MDVLVFGCFERETWHLKTPTEDLIAALSCDFNITLKEDQK
jgi:hypothetical protein